MAKRPMTSKEILTHFKLPLKYEPMGQTIWDADSHMVAQVRGWGRLQYKEGAEDIQDGVGQMLVDAFNEKYLYNPDHNLAQNV